MTELENMDAIKHGELKDTNPKDMIASNKLPLHLWPGSASALGCLGLLDGALKYGRANWRVTGVRATVYVDALKRHVEKWVEGEDIDPDSGVPHLGHALACLAILVDSQAAGKLTDDRQVDGKYHRYAEALTAFVGPLRAKHADKTPRHYTIADNARLQGCERSEHTLQGVVRHSDSSGGAPC